MIDSRKKGTRAVSLIHARFILKRNVREKFQNYAYKKEFSKIYKACHHIQLYNRVYHQVILEFSEKFQNRHGVCQSY